MKSRLWQPRYTLLRRLGREPCGSNVLELVQFHLIRRTLAAISYVMYRRGDARTVQAGARAREEHDQLARGLLNVAISQCDFV